MSSDFDPWGSPERKPANNKPANNNKPNNQGGGAPPGLDEVFDKLTSLLRGKGSSSGNSNGTGNSDDAGKAKMPNPFGLGIVVAAGLLFIWFALGFYILDEQERGVTLRLGKYFSVLEPGLRWQPFLVDTVIKVNVTNVREQQFDGEMLTEDENIVDIKTSVQYVIKDPRVFVLAIRHSEEGLSLATDSALRHVVGSTKLDDVITTGREQVANEVHVRVQDYVDSYESGLLISKVSILESKAPDEVKGAFDDVIKAREDKVRVINQATTYENGIIPQARGNAKRIFEEAAGYRDATIAKAEGEAERFTKLATEYTLAPAITGKRLYIQTLENILQNTSKVLVDTGSEGNNLFYLPLDQLVRTQRSSNVELTGGSTQDMNNSSVQRITDQVIQELQRRQGGSSSGVPLRQSR